MFKKFCSIYSLIFTAWLYFHIIYSILYVVRVPGTTMDASLTIATITWLGVIVHGVLSLITFFFFKGIDYCKKGHFFRGRTFIQILITIVIVALLFIHSDSDKDYSEVPIVIKTIVIYVFIISVMLHICFSVGKAFKTLGIVKTDKGIVYTTRVFVAINGVLLFGIACSLLYISTIY